MSTIKLGTNTASLMAQRRLAEGTNALSRTYERLSSGQRINRASDDAAGLAIADSLRASSRIFNQGVRNLNDGLSLLNIADSAIANLSSIVVRLEELAEQSANGTYSSTQRKALDAEAQALSKEYFRISKTTKFNGTDLLGGSLGQVNLQAGFGDNSVLSAGVGGAIGTGTFGASTSFLAEALESFALAVGDLNGDGLPDLVSAGTADGPDGFATVRLNQGHGVFGAAISLATESRNSRAMTLGDVNGDGVLDLVSAGYSDAGDGYATVRIGLGNGTFANGTSYSTEGRMSQAIVLGDINGDGVLDLVTAGFTDLNDGYTTVRVGAGDGTFGEATSYSTESSNSRGVVLGDLNCDGLLDLVTAGVSDAGDGHATVRIGVGDGTFGEPVSYANEDAVSAALTLADLNNDGLLDLITAGSTDALDGVATVRLGIGDGTFGEATSYATESRLSRALALADLNGDGLLDLVTTGRAEGDDGVVTVRLGLGDGSFDVSISFAAESRESRAIVIGDLNGDGALDLATAGKTDVPYDGEVHIRFAITRDGVAPLLPFSLKTMADARQALPVLKQKRDQLAAQRGQIGAFQSRIGVASNVLQVTSENFRAAESRIRDADMAQEAADLVRLNILQQAASSVLAQANQQPAIAIRLLQQ